ncbi:hypothetical protein CAFE_20530 [Caprobacter fermentans]|uniref:Lin1244/Lin1753-like N-terminal domain-containing protein n=1 Tax=Caproicibacter fermentans TaxID=2576756 RepID=A0A6N8I0R4_9FIRM|nr:DUF4373 domain-containing protein [Caproicibacter fermentans]MVB11340.1 hypothetical protein [Caproicibacter fermentans]
MARPRKDTLDYFPHDTDAASDEKIEAMRALYGNDGYAFYFLLLERIYKGNGVLDIQNPSIRTAIARNITSDSGLFDKMLDTAFDIGLFDKALFDEKGVLSSPAIERRTTSINGERSRKREWAQRQSERQKDIDVQNPSNRQQLTHKVKVKDKITPIPPTGIDGLFDTFWKAYPKKVGKGAAEKSFKKYKPDDTLLSAMLKAIIVQKDSKEWTKDEGQYIPNPSTWLNQRRWEDETPSTNNEGSIPYLT